LVIVAVLMQAAIAALASAWAKQQKVLHGLAVACLSGIGMSLLLLGFRQLPLSLLSAEEMTNLALQWSRLFVQVNGGGLLIALPVALGVSFLTHRLPCLRRYLNSVVTALLLIVVAGLLVHLGSEIVSTPAVSPTVLYALPTQNPYPPHTGTLILSDPLHDNSKGYKWDEATLGSASCGFSKGTYHIKVPKKGTLICNPEAKSLFHSNLAYEVRLEVIEGGIEGIAFRFDQRNGTGYVFLVDTQHGVYLLVADNGKSGREISKGSSPAIKNGLDQSNMLAVVADGSTMSLYINRQFIVKTNDKAYSQGQLGIFTADLQYPADIEASNASAWAL
jgi:hypothetical protein